MAGPAVADPWFCYRLVVNFFGHLTLGPLGLARLGLVFKSHKLRLGIGNVQVAEQFAVAFLVPLWMNHPLVHIFSDGLKLPTRNPLEGVWLEIQKVEQPPSVHSDATQCR